MEVLIAPERRPARADLTAALRALGFRDADDFYGIWTDNAATGDDVVVWAYPLIDDVPRIHQDGPFDAVRLQFNVLRNAAPAAARFLEAARMLREAFDGTLWYRTRHLRIADLEIVESDIARIRDAWAEVGVAAGSPEAMAAVEY